MSNITFDCVDRSRFKGEKDTLALFAWEGEKFNSEGWLDAKKEKLLDDIARREHFKARPADVLAHYPEREEPALRLVLAGLGKKKESDLNRLRDASARIFKSSNRQTESLWIDLPAWPEKAAPAVLAQMATEGILLARYQFQSYKTSPEGVKDSILRKVTIVVQKPDEIAEVKVGVRRGERFSEAANFVRDLVNEPPSLKRPEIMGKTARSLASSRIKVRVYAKAEIQKLGMNALLGVNSGSAHDPIFVHMTYKPKGTPKKKIGLIGKGITFDSGGLNIKNFPNMLNMKMDMAGGATVMSCLRACEALDSPHEVHAFAPFTENMPGADAYKPGDVVRALNGKTIEILNTDAEGRVVLADALSFAAKQDLDILIDVATLTGAVIIALGDEISGLLSNNDRLAAELQAAAKTAGEKVWPLPLAPEYKERIKGKVGDWANISTRGAGSEPGSIIGGLFLEEFVDGKPWAHLDIAGTAWTDAEKPTCPAGGTGAGVRTILEYLLTN